MAIKQNCWEFKQCGRIPGGARAAEIGVCLAFSDASCNGLNEGKNAGRFCWAVAGTLCGGKIQGDFAQKRITCLTCDFFKKVKQEEGDNFKLTNG